MYCSIRNGCMAVMVTTLFILGGIIVYIDPLINHFMFKEIVIANNSQMFEYWERSPVVPHLKLYFFNVSNHNEFLNGSKPIIQEVGPYCYRERWQKVNISFHDNGTVSYQTKRYIYFERSLSVGSEDDLITTLNIPLISAVNKMRYSYVFMRRVLSGMFEGFHQEAFATHTVKELLWGYEDPLLEIAQDILDEPLPIGNKFGFFTNHNGSADGLLNTFTGENGMDKYSIIDTFRHENKLSFWKTDECNTIKGTDGSAFPPGITRNTTLNIFNENFCRSIPLTYVQDIKQYGLDAYQFSPPVDVFDYNVDANKCFCTRHSGCTSRGLFNISACQMGSPIMLSWPHFYQADPEYLEAVDGLSPNPEKHAFLLNVSPRTGSPIGTQASLQINIATVSDPLIKQVADLKEMIFPVLWFEYGVTELPEDIIHLLQLSTDAPEITKLCLKCVAIVLGCITVIFMGINITKQIRSWKDMDNISKESKVQHDKENVYTISIISKLNMEK